MNRSVRRAVTLFSVLFVFIGLGVTTVSADELVSPDTVVSELAETTLQGEPRDSMVWD